MTCKYTKKPTEKINDSYSFVILYNITFYQIFNAIR